MKRLFYIPLLFIFLLNCKKEKVDTQPDEIMKPLVGKWLLRESEKIVDGEKLWVPFSGFEAQYLNFRFDGILLDENGKASCCTLYRYNINNTTFEVKPRAAVSYTDDCSKLQCDYFCSAFNIEVNGDEMLFSVCSPLRAKYVRAE